MLRFNNEECNKCSPSGFTLIELLIVIMLMAIVIGIATPAFIGMGRGVGMRGAVSGVCSTLTSLRQWAITHREQVTFCYFQGASGSESFYYATNEFGAIISTNDPPKLPMDVMFSFDPPGPISGIVTFKTDGGLMTIGAATADIIIADRKSKDPSAVNQNIHKTIKINGLTGGIHVE